MALNMLFVGDIHLGKKPSKIPESLEENIDCMSPAYSWQKTVEYALAHSIHAVLLAGDVVEKEHDFFEAYRELQKGVQKLVDKGIQVLAVAGNHDVKVLPKLAEQIPLFQLVGAKGQWQSVELRNDLESVTIWGWSFTDRHVKQNPLKEFDHSINRNAVNIGLLHCDLDQMDSSYGPVSTQDLLNTRFEAWFLGHIHKPSRLSLDQKIGYLGSLVGTNPKESGEHGPWHVVVSGNKISEIKQVLLNPLHWHHLEVSVENIHDENDFRAEILKTIMKLDQQLHLNYQDLKFVALRIIFNGRKNFQFDLKTVLTTEELNSIYVGSNHCQYFVEKIIDQTRVGLDIDIDILTKQNSPLGVIAKKIQILQNDDGSKELLIQELKSKLEDEHLLKWGKVKSFEMTDEEVRQLMLKSSWSLLEKLVAQEVGQS